MEVKSGGYLANHNGPNHAENQQTDDGPISDLLESTRKAQANQYLVKTSMVVVIALGSYRRSVVRVLKPEPLVMMLPNCGHAWSKRGTRRALGGRQ